VTMRAPVVTDTDVALLRSLALERSVVAASRHVGISRDRANYRLGRLTKAFGGPVVTSQRGGPGHGGTRLTALGDRIVRQGFDSIELLDARPFAPVSRSNRVRGVYRGAPAPGVELGHGVRLRIAFPAREGETVDLLVDPEAILVARGRFPSSARNVLRGTVASVGRGPGPKAAALVVEVGGRKLRVAITPESVRLLRLANGSKVWLYVKATALRRVGRPTSRSTPGSRPS
jgi:molybdopterin-binding protein/molybdate transport repressor ModE-like protein